MSNDSPSRLARASVFFVKRVLLPVALCAATVAAVSAAPAPFHLHLVRSFPAANASVNAAPDSIRLWFSQKPELKVTTVKVIGPKVTTVATAPLVAAAARGDTSEVVAPIKAAMPAGSYIVMWRTMSKDGHAVSGTFSFMVTAAGR